MEEVKLSYLARGTEPHYHPSRPTTVYHTSLNSGEVEGCGNGVCNWEYAFINLGKKTCKAKYENRQFAPSSRKY